jgi:hypothetical protein
MKKLVLLLTLLNVCYFSNAQTIGDHLNSIKETRSGGTFNTTTNKDYPYTYVVTNTESQSVTAYAFDQNLICRHLGIYVNPEYRNVWIKIFNDTWVTVSTTQWRYYLDSGMVIYCKLQLVEDVGLIFVIGEEGKEN